MLRRLILLVLVSVGAVACTTQPALPLAENQATLRLFYTEN